MAALSLRIAFYSSSRPAAAATMIELRYYFRNVSAAAVLFKLTVQLRRASSCTTGALCLSHCTKVEHPATP